MDIEEFKEIVLKDDPSTYKWRENMLLASKLYKARGFKVKDIKENSLIEDVFIYLTNLFKDIQQPSVEDFVRYKFVEEKFSDIDDLRSVVDESFLGSLFGKSSEDIDETHTENDESLLSGLYKKIGRNSIHKLINDESFIRTLSNYLSKKHGPGYLKEVKGKGIAYDNLIEFFSSDAKCKASVQNAFLSEAKSFKRKYEDLLKESLIKRITTITKFLDDVGHLEEMARTTNLQFGKLGLYPLMVNTGKMDDFTNALDKDKILEYSNNLEVDEKRVLAKCVGVMLNSRIAKNSKAKDNYSKFVEAVQKSAFDISNLKNPEYYNKFSPEELFVFSAFYSNRFEKISSSLAMGVYLHEKFDSFYYTVLDGEVPSKIKEADAKSALRQRNFMLGLNRDSFKDYVDGIDNKIIDEENSDEYIDVPNEYLKMYNDVYKQYFDRYLPDNANDFEFDYRLTFLDRAMQEYMYRIKDFSMESLLYALSREKTKMNFGIIPEDKSTKNEYGEKQVLIGVDYKGMQTIRLHIPQTMFKKISLDYFPNNSFPAYYGKDDFNINDNEIKTLLLYGYTKEQCSLIKKLSEELPDGSEHKKFVNHAYGTIHPNRNQLNQKKNR